MADEYDLSSVTPATPEGKPYDLSNISPGSGVLRRLVADPLVAFAGQGPILAGQSLAGLADVGTVGLVGNAIQNARGPETKGGGIIHNDWRPTRADYLPEPRDVRADFTRAGQIVGENLYSPEQQAANEAVNKATEKGVLSTLSALAANPSAIPSNVLQQLPQMIGGGGLSRLGVKTVEKAAPGLAARLGIELPVLAGAAGEGAVTAGQNLEQVREESPTGLVTPKQVALNALAGLITGGIAYGGGRLAQRAGFVDPETWLAGGKLPPGKKPLSMPARVAGGAISEAGQETAQSAQEQVFQNLSQGKPWDEGVGGQAALGGVIGGAMGGGANVLSLRPHSPNPPATPPDIDLLGPVSAAAAKVPGLIPPTQAPPWRQAEPGGTQEMRKAAPQPAEGTPPAEPTSPAPGTPVAPLERALPTEAMAQRAADLETKRSGEPQAVMPGDNGGFVVRPQATVDTQEAEAAKVDEARQAGETAKTEQLKAAEEAATVASTPAKEGEPPEKIYKKDARDYIADIQGSIDTMRTQIDTLRSATPEDSAYIPKIEKQIEQAEKKQKAIAKRAGIEFTPGETNAVPKSSGSRVLPYAPERAGGAGSERGGVGQGEQGIKPAQAGQEEGRGAGAVAGPAEGVAQGAANVPATEQKPVAQDISAGTETAAAASGAAGDQIDRSAPAPATPTQAQAQAGNYEKDHISVGGLDIAIENREGTTRYDKEHPTPQWETEIKGADYGYIKRTESADTVPAKVAPDGTVEAPAKKQGLDVFVKPGTVKDYKGPVYVIDQVNQKTEDFDETKTMVGYASKAEALKVYRSNYPKGWKTGTITEAPLPVFEQWAKSPQSTEPFRERSTVPLEKVVTLKVREEETGRPAEVDMPAHEAIDHLDRSIQRAKDLLGMSITLKSEEVQRHVASGRGRYVFEQKPKPPVVEPSPPPDTSLADAVNKVAVALAQGQQEQREALLHQLSVTEQLVTALGEIGKPEPLSPWRATVVSRDSLGRIKDVDFIPR